MHFHIITLFPNSFDSYLGESILSRAIEDKKISVKFYNPRDFSDNKFRHIDQKPYSGGPGMVIQAEPVAKAIDAAFKIIEARIKKQNTRKTKKMARMPLATKMSKSLFDTKLKIKIIFFSVISFSN